MDELRFSVYTDSLEPDLPVLFRRMEEEAVRDRVPILRPETASFLETLLTAVKPENILEIGTAIGYSALRMHRAAPEARITTLELDQRRADRAEVWFSEAEALQQVRLIRGDAALILPALKESYDFIFLDGPKGQYLHYLPELKRLLKKGGLLFTDNILQEGTLLESRFAVERRDRTIHERMRQFVRLLYQDPQMKTSLLPLEDGVLLSVKKSDDHEQT